jgi:hypothetical protein
MRELGEDDELDRQERRVADDRVLDHGEHAVDVGGDAAAVERIREVGRAGGGGVADGRRHRSVRPFVRGRGGR